MVIQAASEQVRLLSTMQAFTCASFPFFIEESVALKHNNDDLERQLSWENLSPSFSPDLEDNNKVKVYITERTLQISGTITQPMFFFPLSVS